MRRLVARTVLALAADTLWAIGDCWLRAGNACSQAACRDHHAAATDQPDQETPDA